MSRKRRGRRPCKSADHSSTNLEAEVARLSGELTEARTRLKHIEQHGIAVATAQRLAALEEGQMVARGQALEAIRARSQAEAEFRALQKAIHDAPGVAGWLLRRAVRHLKITP
ncbi:hypothetical protein [Muricoccus radiodurans]|uniref:hypothetical protein n=1 Tax=Muricoccus radiodurans TaxID=2231721 RepID=UPI003CF73E92